MRTPVRSCIMNPYLTQRSWGSVSFQQSVLEVQERSSKLPLQVCVVVTLRRMGAVLHGEVLASASAPKLHGPVTGILLQRFCYYSTESRTLRLHLTWSAHTAVGSAITQTKAMQLAESTRIACSSTGYPFPGRPRSLLVHCTWHMCPV